MATKMPETKKLQTSDLNRAWWIWTFFNLSAFSMERMQAPAFVYMMSPILNRLYGDKPDEIKAALKLGGTVIFETYLIDQPAIGHPKNPAYLLEHNELLNFFCDFRVLYYREGQFSERGERAFRAGIFAQKIR